MKNTRSLFLILFVLVLLVLLNSCAHIEIPNTEVCTVAGKMSAGADCSMTLSDETREMNMDEFLEFLEPSEKENRGGAMCQSVSDWNKQKTALEQACEKLGKACTYEIRAVLSKVTKNMETLQNKASTKEQVVMVKILSIPTLGQSNPDVRTIQEQLKVKGYDVKPDGVFGPKTRKAISDLQKSNGLEGSGIIGPKTLMLLDIQVVTMSGGTITKDLVGKKTRFLHPTLRTMIESKVFPGGKIPDCFKNKEVQNCVVEVARAMEGLNVREQGGNNRGMIVGLIQSVIGPVVKNGTGDAWCMSTDQCIIAFLEDYFGVESPIVDSEHCVTVHNSAKKVDGLIADSCEFGTFWIARQGTSSRGHTGTVLDVLKNGRMNTFEGNTGNDSIRDGDGAYFRTRYQNKNGNLQTLSFVRLYPYNKVV